MLHKRPCCHPQGTQQSDGMGRTGTLQKFRKEKCKALHLGRNNPMHQCVLGALQLESSLAEKDQGVHMN